MDRCVQWSRGDTRTAPAGRTASPQRCPALGCRPHHFAQTSLLCWPTEVCFARYTRSDRSDCWQDCKLEEVIYIVFPEQMTNPWPFAWSASGGTAPLGRAALVRPDLKSITASFAGIRMSPLLSGNPSKTNHQLYQSGLDKRTGTKLELQPPQECQFLNLRGRPAI